MTGGKEPPGHNDGTTHVLVHVSEPGLEKKSPRIDVVLVHRLASELPSPTGR